MLQKLKSRQVTAVTAQLPFIEKNMLPQEDLTAVTAAAAVILSSRWIPICLLWLTSAIKENIWLQTAKMEEKTAVTEKMQKIW